MATFRRLKVPGGTYFFTVALADRRSDLLIRKIESLRHAYAIAQQRRPFETVAICILPDHLHAVWTLPEDDSDFSMRWNLIKSGFARALPASATRSRSLTVKREKGQWQRRFWEHVIRDDRDMERHVNYIHFNPVKHRLVTRVADWPHSSFHRYVARGDLPMDWGGDMGEIVGTFGE
jgi:putative transposase